MFLQDHLIKGPCDCMCAMPLMAGHYSAKTSDHRLYGSGDIPFLIFHVILQDDVTQDP